MSGELADCFESKMEGISFIVNAVRNAFHSARFYGTDGQFHGHAVPRLAAANWLASADYLRAEYPDAVLLDIGSTTADVIPLAGFASMKGLTDLRRLQKGYLIYTGMLRGNIATLLHSVTLERCTTPVSSEYFAISADAHLVLGHITPAQYSCDTPDKKEKTKKAAFRRIARVVCADPRRDRKRWCIPDCRTVLGNTAGFNLRSGAACCSTVRSPGDYRRGYWSAFVLPGTGWN